MFYSSSFYIGLDFLFPFFFFFVSNFYSIFGFLGFSICFQFWVYFSWYIVFYSSSFYIGLDFLFLFFWLCDFYWIFDFLGFLYLISILGLFWFDIQCYCYLHLNWFSLFINYYNLWVFLLCWGCSYFGFSGNCFWRLGLVSIVVWDCWTCVW